MSGNNGSGKGKGKSNAAGHIDVKLLDVTGGHIDAPPTFPGWEGLPFKGPPPTLKQGDPQSKQPTIGMKVHVETLDLAKPKDMAHYRDICQAIGNGYAQLSKEDMRYDEKVKNWRVFIRWLELVSFEPTKGNPNGYGR